MEPALSVALVAGVLAGAGGWAVPRLIAAIPEPAPSRDVPAGPVGAPVALDPSVAPGHADEEVEAVTGRKVAYAVIGGVPGLGWKSAVASAVAGGLVGAAVGWSWALVPLLFLVPVGVALAVVDWRTQLLPTRVIAPSFVVVVALVLLGWAVTGEHEAVVRAGWGWLGAGGLFGLLWLVHPRGMGYGDVRLSGVLGIALGQLGWGPLVIGIYAGFVLGGVGGVVLARAGRGSGRQFPFGPFMLAGALVGVLVGAPLWDGLVPGAG